MSSAQKTIKYVAVGLAIFLIVMIFSAIINFGFGLLNSFGNFSSNTTKSNIDHNKYETYLDINIKYADVKIIKSDILKVKNDNDKINVEQDGNNRLIITDSSSVIKKKDATELVIYVPEDIIFDIININSGAGKINIDGFNTKELILNLGAGKSVIKNVTSNKTKIDAGAGSLNIVDCKLNDANLDLGVGSINISSSITGNSTIDCGIGSVNLNLDSDDYKFEIDKGIGNITLNNTAITDDIKTIGTGTNYIKIDGGIGEIIINAK